MSCNSVGIHGLIQGQFFFIFLLNINIWDNYMMHQAVRPHFMDVITSSESWDICMDMGELNSSA
jgi:hypothetical protein